MSTGRDAAAALSRQLEELRQKLAEVEASARSLLNPERAAPGAEGLLATATSESAQHFRTAFDAVPEALVLLDDAGRYLHLNSAATALLGQSPERLLGRRIADLELPGADFKHAWRAFLKTGSSMAEGRIVRPDGSVRSLEIRATASIRPGCHLALIRDVTERRRAGDALRWTTAVVEASDDGIVGTASDGTIVSWNGRAEALFGYAAREVRGRSLAMLVPLERHDEIPDMHEALRRGERRGPRETVWLAKDGVRIEVLVTLAPVRDAGGRLLGASTVVRDLTEHRRAEAEVRRREAQLRTLTTSLPDAMLRVDAELRVTAAAGPIEVLTGTPASALPGRPARDALSAAAPGWEDALARCLQTGEPARIEITSPAPAPGEPPRRFDCRILPETGPDGARQVLAIFGDVSEQRRLEDELRENRSLLERAQEVARVGSWTTAVGSDRVRASREMLRIFGLDPEGFDGRIATLFERVAREDARMVREAFASALTSGAPLNIDHRILRPDGSLRWVHEQGETVHDAAGRPAMVGTVQDVTEQRHLEEQLRHSDKMRAIGQLAGGLAHDFNNLLTAVLGYSDIILRSLASGDPTRRPLEEIRKAGQRAAALTRQLLAFGRKQILVPEVLDLGSVVTDLTHLLQRLIGEDILLMTVLHPKPARVRADRGQIEQVIVNLAVNARDAMPNGGRLVLDVNAAVLDEAHAQAHVDAAPGHYALLAISDTGVGMDEETRSHIFEPFFTTKEKGRGTGLGLSTVYGIVQQSGGHVTVVSEPGRGTTFNVYLPHVGDPLEAATNGGPSPLSGGDETILLAEDDPTVRGIAAEILRGSGYRVLEASDGQAALGLARRHPGPIHLLLTDLVMPGMTGAELAEAFARAYPRARVLFMSGYAEDAIASRGTPPSADDYLPKPLTPDALTRKVREVLSR